MTTEELIERVLPGDIHRETPPAPAGSAPHLPEARDRAGEGDADRGVELPDVDPELERVGRDDAEQLPGREPALDLLTLRGRVPGAIWRDALGELRIEPVAGVAQDQLDALARLHEADRPCPGADQLREDLGRLVQRRGPDAELLVEQRRIPHHGVPLGPRRGVVVDQVEVGETGESLGELNRVRDRRAREQEPRIGAVDRRRPSQPPQDVGDVRAEHAAVHVRLVDDDEREVRQQVVPALVVGQDPDVEHVGVREDEVAALPDRGPLVARRVAVVDRGADRLVQAEGVEHSRLVLGERLGRIQVEGASGPVGAQHLKRR